jgi:HEPN domain-containing protein
MNNPQFAFDLLAVAHQDLKAARHLYKGGYYPQAVFYLQQSVEKGLKSYSVTWGMINENESQREISHKTLKIYEKSTRDLKKRAIAEKEEMKKNPVMAALEPHINFPLMVGKLDEVLEELKDQKKQDEKLLRLTEEELNNAIKTLQDIHRDTNHEKVKLQTKTVTTSEFRKAKKNLLELLEALLVGQPERLRKMKEELNRNFTMECYEEQMRVIQSQIIGPMEIFSSFFELSKILQPHAVARYPKSGFNPLELYTLDFPLVKSFPKLADITERVLNQVDDLYQKSEG